MKYNNNILCINKSTALSELKNSLLKKNKTIKNHIYTIQAKRRINKSIINNKAKKGI